MRRRWWHSGLVWTAIGSITAVLALGVSTVPLLKSGESSREVAARNVRDCQRDHGLGQAAERRPTRPGESDIAAPTPLPPYGFKQTTFALCSWPPPPGGNADGYRAIVVTEVDGPGGDEASGVVYADRIESNCAELSAGYQFGSQGGYENNPPISGRPGEVLNVYGEPYVPEPLREGETGQLPFYPARDELVVLHNSKNVLDTVECVS